MDNKQNAGFIVRALASITDGLLFTYPLTILMMLASVVYVFEKDKGFAIFAFGSVFLFLLLMLIPLGLAYTVYFTSKYGGTIGKLIFGLRVVNKSNNQLLDKKQSFYRLILGYIFSSQMLGLGFFKVIKSPEKLAWHDELFDTKVLVNRNIYLGLAIATAIIIVGIALCAVATTFVVGLASAGIIYK